MASSFFDFKQFRVFHEQSAMKVGTDSVILGAIVPLDASIKRVADIGSGCGILSLMIAQRCKAQIDAIEINLEAAEECGKNFNLSPWSDRLSVYAHSIQKHQEIVYSKYDLLISNPPYFEQDKNFGITKENRGVARQTKDLNFLELAQIAKQSLSDAGQFWLILPTLEANVFINIAQEIGLYLVEQILVRPKPTKEPNRMVMGFALHKSDCKDRELLVYSENGLRSEQYFALTQDFYL